MTTAPDLFTNVHKGIRRALFAACTALGSAGGDPDRERSARALVTEALHFVAHHGDNEDALFVPLLRARAPAAAARMADAHAALDAAREAVRVDGPLAALYLATCAFTSAYLAHLDEEERVLEPQIRAALTLDEQLAVGRRSVERTAPADQRMMIGWMLPAMTRGDADAFLGCLPPQLAAELRALAT